jgi:hypothetical protein
MHWKKVSLAITLPGLALPLATLLTSAFNASRVYRIIQIQRPSPPPWFLTRMHEQASSDPASLRPPEEPCHQRFVGKYRDSLPIFAVTVVNR